MLGTFDDIPGDIKLKKGEEGFWLTFDLYPVHDEWAVELYNYFMMGWPPGSFHTACFANDLYRATCSSHPQNNWTDIRAFMKWVGANAPPGSWGNPGNVERWLKEEDAESRRIIHEAKGWKLPEDQLVWKIVSEE